MSSKIHYEAETRLNGRGGWEVAEPGSPAGSGIGNYPTEADAFAFACYNFTPKRIKRGEEPARSARPAKQPTTAGRIVRRVKALTR
jgi:hypothetical protein